MRISDRMRKEPHLLAEQLAELGFTEAKPIQAYADPEHIPWVTELVVAAGGEPPA